MKQNFTYLRLFGWKIPYKSIHFFVKNTTNLKEMLKNFMNPTYKQPQKELLLHAEKGFAD